MMQDDYASSLPANVLSKLKISLMMHIDPLPAYVQGCYSHAVFQVSIRESPFLDVGLKNPLLRERHRHSSSCVAPCLVCVWALVGDWRNCGVRATESTRCLEAPSLRGAEQSVLQCGSKQCGWTPNVRPQTNQQDTRPGQDGESEAPSTGQRAARSSSRDSWLMMPDACG